MKINIIFDFKDSPTGGGNQFLKALKSYFISIKAYEEDPAQADIFLFNSHHCLKRVFLLKLKYPEKLFIHRVDGPIELYNTKKDRRDDIIFLTNELIADGTVFQSYWSRRMNKRQGMITKTFETVISNAVDPTLFNSNDRIPFSTNRKLKLVAASWSSNIKKGFKIYEWLDNNLNFEKYEMTFIGNSPVFFKNIRHIKPLKSADLALELKKNDIFITASQKDPCSNSLIEALSTGLPVIAFNDGGHPELLGKAGELFVDKEEIPNLIEIIADNYASYLKRIDGFSMEIAGESYFRFLEKVFLLNQNRKYIAKRFELNSVFIAKDILRYHFFK